MDNPIIPPEERRQVDAPPKVFQMLLRVDSEFDDSIEQRLDNGFGGVDVYMENVHYVRGKIVAGPTMLQGRTALLRYQNGVWLNWVEIDNFALDVLLIMEASPHQFAPGTARIFAVTADNRPRQAQPQPPTN